MNLGGGTQSTVMAMLLDREEIGPRPDCAIFADTGDEPPTTLSTVEWLTSVVSYPVHVVRAPVDIVTATRSGTDAESIPIGIGLPTHTVDGDGSHGMGRRFCTNQWKIRVIDSKVREMLGVEKGKQVPRGIVVDTFLGLSLEEISRMRDPSRGWQRHHYPLIDAKMTRHDVRLWWQRKSSGT